MIGVNVWFWTLGGGLVAVGVVCACFRTTPWSWWRRQRDTRQRVLAEDAIKYIYHASLSGQPATADALAGALRRSPRATIELIARLQTNDWARTSGSGLTLTPTGERLALQVIRAHRLWERYLVDEARMPLRSVHAEAERLEHTRSAAELDALDAAMGYPTVDPHGDPIPTSRGEITELDARAVTDWPVNTPARIVHIEDEPPAIFAQVVAEGLRPGQIVRVVESTARRLVLSDGEELHVTSPIVAANIFVASVGDSVPATPPLRLTTLARGRRATVHGLTDELQGFTRRRLLDLGLTPGAEVTAEMSSVFGDPVAYRVRGTLIALRRDQAEHVLIRDKRREQSDG